MASTYISGLVPDSLYPLDPEGDFDVQCMTMEGDGSFVSEHIFTLSPAPSVASPLRQSPGLPAESRIRDEKPMSQCLVEPAVAAELAGC